ncbi:hypothetical protein FF011L_24580 [Roseimaritima multifibrata]|uniref:YfiR family protein n=1 Tax=Roseimaritima multifibrata TaxID=1930274 RepID=A0A517MFM0_9BACT|nr:hypothetical protein FF011L_24580 [Roseimaritima multifibrata]
MFSLVTRSQFASATRQLAIFALVTILGPPVGILALQSTEAQELVVRDAPLKAAYIYNFAKYTRWPESNGFAESDKPFVCGVYGTTPVENYLQKIASKKTIQNVRIVIQHYQTPAEIQTPHILFVSQHVAAEEYAQIVDRLRGKATILIGESFRPTPADTVTFYIKDNRVRFQIDLDRVSDAKVQVSSKVLQLGRLVRGTTVVKSGNP